MTVESLVPVIMRLESIESMGGTVVAHGRSAELPKHDRLRLVAEVVCPTVARVPAWFTVGQALQVARLKGVEHVLVEDRGRICGAVSRTVLRRAPQLDPLSRWLKRTDASVPAQATCEEALDLLDADAVDCLPVTMGGVLVGTVDRAQLESALPGPGFDEAPQACAV